MKHNSDEKKEKPGSYDLAAMYDDLDLITDKLLGDLCKWDFNIFQLYKERPTTCLSSMMFRILHDTELLKLLKLPQFELLHFLHDLEMGYRDVPYHNRLHAADVLQAVYHLTTQAVPGLDENSLSRIKCVRLKQAKTGVNTDDYGIAANNLDPIELFSLFLAAAVHDYDHPGTTNAFLIATKSPLARLYNNQSVLENHHISASWKLLIEKPQNNFLKYMDSFEVNTIHSIVVESVLATDMSKHFTILHKFTSDNPEPHCLNWRKDDERKLYFQLCLKLADISGPCRKFRNYFLWQKRIMKEFYAQGDMERARGLPISLFMDRTKKEVPKSQECFIRALVSPLANAYANATLMPGVWISDDSFESEILRNLKNNYDYWKNLTDKIESERLVKAEE